MRWPWSAAPIPRLDDAQADVLLQDLLSRDATRITDAARVVARLFSASSLDALSAHVDLIEQRCQGIALGGMLISNQAYLKAALRRLVDEAMEHLNVQMPVYFVVSGLDRLPRSIQALPFDADVEASALVYQFRKSGHGDPPVALASSNASAATQLDRSGIVAALRR